MTTPPDAASADPTPLRADDRSLTVQLADLADFAVKLGMFDAARFIYERLAKGSVR